MCCTLGRWFDSQSWTILSAESFQLPSKKKSPSYTLGHGRNFGAISYKNSANPVVKLELQASFTPFQQIMPYDKNNIQ